jgi:hypothetical protein
MSSTKNPGRFAGLLYVLTGIPGFFAIEYVPSKLFSGSQFFDPAPVLQVKDRRRSVGVA